MGVAELELDPGRANHVFCCGRKGSGKSVLAELLWRSYPYDRLVIDPTGDVDAGDDAVDLEMPLPTRWPAQLAAAFTGGDDRRRQTLRFVPDPGASTYIDDMDRAVGIGFGHGRHLLWVDEVGELTSANKTPPAMRRWLHQSRHRRGSGLFCGPRPIDINPLVISQADYVATFDLPNPADRKRVADVCGIQLGVFEAALAKATSKSHGFTWWDAAERELLVMPPLPASVLRRRQPGDRFAHEPVTPDL